MQIVHPMHSGTRRQMIECATPAAGLESLESHVACRGKRPLRPPIGVACRLHVWTPWLPWSPLASLSCIVTASSCLCVSSAAHRHVFAAGDGVECTWSCCSCRQQLVMSLREREDLQTAPSTVDSGYG